MTIDDYKRLAKATARAHDIPPEIFCALCEHESSWDTWAMRYEPAFFDKYCFGLSGMSMTEKVARATSFGLGQVMGQVAREQGYTGRWLTELCDPVTGLEFSARKFKQCFVTAAANPVVALLRYNGGGNPQYADDVMKLVGKYK